jgi:hypothetical protein
LDRRLGGPQNQLRCSGKEKNSMIALAGIPRCRLEDNIRVDHGEIGWEGVDWLHLAQDMDWWWTLVNTVMNIQVP